MFQARKLPAYPDQLLLAKAAMPLYLDMIPVITKVLSNPGLLAAVKAKTPPPDLLVEIMDAGFVGIQKLSNDELLNLTERSLAAIQVRQGDAGWANIMLPTGQLMFDNLELSDIIQLIWTTVEVNLFGFFAAPLGKSQGGDKVA